MKNVLNNILKSLCECEVCINTHTHTHTRNSIIGKISLGEDI